jgi:hypothetical protein
MEVQHLRCSSTSKAEKPPYDDVSSVAATLTPPPNKKKTKTKKLKKEKIISKPLPFSLSEKIVYC